MVACALHSRQNGVCTSLCICRCILHALKVLHQAGFAHTDLRWENIILQHAGQWVLIDLEFACELDSVPFTPVGEPMSCLHKLMYLYVDFIVRPHAFRTYSENLKAKSPRCLFNHLCPEYCHKTSVF